MDNELSYARWRPHPWHGLEVGKNPPGLVRAYIEITPFDLVKYEVDKATGYLRVDRPQQTSSLPPALYGFIPRTYCGHRVGDLASRSKQGDGDPLDICVISDRPINRAELLLDVKVIGGMQMIDNDEADDKIIGVLENDDLWQDALSIGDLPEILLDRLEHYFDTYKQLPGEEKKAWVERKYDRDYALKVIDAAMNDYLEMFGQDGPEPRVSSQQTLAE